MWLEDVTYLCCTERRRARRDPNTGPQRRSGIFPAFYMTHLQMHSESGTTTIHTDTVLTLVQFPCKQNDACEVQHISEEAKEVHFVRTWVWTK